MANGFSNQPKTLKGALVELGRSPQPLMVVFQFNPLTISRTRSATVTPPETAEATRATQNLTLVKQTGGPSTPGSASKGSLSKARAGQTIKVNPETLSFDIRLDATDKLDQGDNIAQQFGIAPELWTLELMMAPKNQITQGAQPPTLSQGAPQSFAFFDDGKNPPVTLFVWGRKKVLPVNITNMQIREEEFNFELYPIRAIVTVSLQVIESANAAFLYSSAVKETLSPFNLAGLGKTGLTTLPK